MRPVAPPVEQKSYAGIKVGQRLQLGDGPVHEFLRCTDQFAEVVNVETGKPMRWTERDWRAKGWKLVRRKAKSAKKAKRVKRKKVEKPNEVVWGKERRKYDWGD